MKEVGTGAAAVGVAAAFVIMVMGLGALVVTWLTNWLIASFHSGVVVSVYQIFVILILISVVGQAFRGVSVESKKD
jgi:hypothetical protein